MEHPSWPLLNTSVEMTAAEFEQHVDRDLSQPGITLQEFQVQRLETIQSADGEYEIDVTARFEALGVKFLFWLNVNIIKIP